MKELAKRFIDKECVISSFDGNHQYEGVIKEVTDGGILVEKDGKVEAMGFEVGPEMMSMMNGFTVLRLFTLMGGMMDVKFTKEELLAINAKLNKIRKPKPKKNK